MSGEGHTDHTDHTDPHRSPHPTDLTLLAAGDSVGRMDLLRIVAAMVVVGSASACRVGSSVPAEGAFVTAPSTTTTTTVVGYTPGDFDRETEAFIADPQGGVASQTGLQFGNAQCVAPSSVAVGTTYRCLAAASDGQVYNFLVTIISPTRFEVGAGDPPVIRRP